MQIKFDKDPLAVKQNNFLTRIVIIYIAYDLLLDQEIILMILNLRIAYLKQLIQ